MRWIQKIIEKNWFPKNFSVSSQKYYFMERTLFFILCFVILSVGIFISCSDEEEINGERSYDACCEGQIITTDTSLYDMKFSKKLINGCLYYILEGRDSGVSVIEMRWIVSLKTIIPCESMPKAM